MIEPLSVARVAEPVDPHLVNPSEAAGSVRLRLALTLPRDASTVSLVRGLLDAALTLIGASPRCRRDLAVALSEACTNAVEHARDSDGYDIVLTAHDDRCVIEVVDTGVGLPPADPDRRAPGILPDRGRGLLLIRAFTDRMEVRPVSPRGVAVRMTKNLV